MSGDQAQEEAVGSAGVGTRPEESPPGEPNEGDRPDEAAQSQPLESGSGFDRWRRDSAVGAVGTGIARGLQSVFAPPVDEPVIVASVPGDPPGEENRIRVILDPDDPSKSVAIVPEHPERAEPTS